MAKSTLTGSPEELQQAASDSLAALGELESQLQALAGCRDGLQTAVQSISTGPAIYQKLDTAWTGGKSLAQTLQQIIDAMKQNGVNISTQDEQGAAKVAAQQGLDSYNSAAAHHDLSRVDVGSWS